MKKTNKFLAIILAILMVISIIPITASAETPTSGTCGENLTWNIDVETWTLTISGTGDMYDYKSNNLPWEEFAENVKTVVINDGVTTIGENAFKRLTRLAHVEIGNDVKTIGEFALNGCYTLDSVIIGSGVTQVSDYAFSGCNSLNYIYYMGTEAEYNEIDWYEISEDEYDMTWFRVEYIFVKDIETDSGKCGNNLTWSYDVPTCTLTISGTGDMDDYNYYNTPPWYQWRFFIKDVVMEEGITKIGELAFNGCGKLETATIPDGVEIISNGAFNTCYSLKDITIPDSVTTINYGAFSSCSSLISVAMGTGVTNIGEYAFAGCDNLIDVYYSGIEEEWNEINISDYNEPLLKATIHYAQCEHNYNFFITPPTCTEQGYTTYTCDCGDTYVDDCVDALGHTEEIIPAVAPTCTETGLTEGTECSVCGETLTGQEELPANGHTHANAIEENYVLPTCIENGSKDVVIYCSVCDEAINRETITIDATEHEDNDGDGYCDMDNELLDPSVECDHACHSDNFFRSLFWKIINFFNKLFGLNKYCECGAVHY